jgi:hypothetical protein
MTRVRLPLLIMAALGGCGGTQVRGIQHITTNTPAAVSEGIIRSVLLDIKASETGVLEVYVRNTGGQPRLFLGTMLADQARPGQWQLVVVQDAHDPEVRVICLDAGPPDGTTDGCLLESTRVELDSSVAQRIYQGIMEKLQNAPPVPRKELGT